MTKMRAKDLADAETPLVANCWYVAATSEDLGDDLIGRWLLGRSVLLYRKADGSPAALDNRCPHRSFPLSQGRKIGDNVACGYHGMTFDPQGRCVDVPAIGKAPANLRTHAYPIVERSPLLWIWMGDPAEADETAIPDYFSLTTQGWAAVSGFYAVHANYVGLQENLQDLSHFEHLHASTIGVPDQSNAEIIIEADDQAIRSVRVYADVPVPPIWAKAMPLKGGRVTRTIREIFRSPALCEAHMTITDLAASEPDEREYHTRIFHFITPASQHETHYWWYFLRDFDVESADTGEMIRSGIAGAFEEDKQALEWISDLSRNDTRKDFREMSFVSDKPGVLMRRRLQQLADREVANSGS